MIIFLHLDVFHLYIDFRRSFNHHLNLSLGGRVRVRVRVSLAYGGHDGARKQVYDMAILR